jgi:hypothetical protein
MMNIEQIIKKSLENHELPYNEAAWESLSKRLDGTTPSPFYRKWWIAASVGTVLVGSALFFALNSQSESAQKMKENAPAISQNTTTEQTTNLSESRLDKNEHTSPQTNTHQTEKHVSNGIQSTPVENGNNQNNENHWVQTSKGDANSATQNAQGSLKSPSDDGGAQKTNYLPANTNKTRYCIGDEIEIANPNDNASVSVIQNNKTILVVKPGTRKVFSASNEGVIDLVIGNQKQTISVSKPSSDLYISVDPTLLYEDGVPAIRFTVSGNNAPVHWTVEKHAFETENGALIVHPYKGKEISVSASAKDQNGCVVVEPKTITLSEDYNLNAQEAIDLNSNDSRVSTFMPHALKERKTPFELYIYDAKSGRVIYKTTDVSAGWNGVDSNTGEVLKNGTVVLWKVVMGNPNPGEPREYKGTLVIRTQ